MKKMLISVFFLITFIIIGRPAFALPIPAISITGGDAAPDGANTYGWQFSLDNPKNVTHLGFYDSLDDGLSDSHHVGIFSNIDTTLLFSVTVPAATGATLDNGFRYIELAISQSLAAGSYTIGAYSAANSADLILASATGFNPSSQINYITGVISTTPSLTLSFPSFAPNSDFQPGFFGPNFKFEPAETIPTPDTLILIFSGLGFIGIRKKLQS